MGAGASAPFFCVKGGSFANYAQEVGIWRQVTNLGAAKRASALIAYMALVAREVCMAAGSNQIMEQIMVREVVE